MSDGIRVAGGQSLFLALILAGLATAALAQAPPQALHLGQTCPGPGALCQPLMAVVGGTCCTLVNKGYGEDTSGSAFSSISTSAGIIHGPAGPMIVQSAEEEEAARREVAEKAVETVAFRPTAEVRKLLDQTIKDGRELDGIINGLLLAPPKADAAPAKSAGRPTACCAEYAGQATKLCRLGATDAQLADFFGVDDRTIARWKAGKPEFCRALEEGRQALKA
jgi:hypothetical protein